jgi:uncharacterized repeat protein (TIGR02543 family)
LGSGGVNHADNPATYTIDTSIVMKQPSRKGYTFTGWIGDSIIVKGSTGDKSVTAKWTATVYTINYELDSGENHANNPATYTTDSAEITLQAPSRTGYTFAGWAEGAGTIPTGSTGDKTFTAKWKATAYTITYTLGSGGVNHADNPATYTIDTSIVLKQPSRKGYTFTGWIGDSIIVKGSTGDKRVTAKWTATVYNISYVLDGGDNHAANPTTYTTDSAEITLPAPSRTGYTFAGWAEGAGTIPTGSTGDKTFTAQWTPTSYTVAYVLNGGINHADNPATYTIESAEITLQAPSRTGYNFTGWAEGSSIAQGSTGDKTFTAQWSAIVYNISYELDGGVNHADNPATYTIEDAVALADPGRTGFVFDGWKEGSTIAAGSVGDKTFTALWKCDEAKIVDILVDGQSTKDLAVDGGFKYSQKCGQSSVTLKLDVSPQASVKINGERYPSSGYTLSLNNTTNVTIEVTSETGKLEEYTFTVTSPVNGANLYYQRWSDVLALNRNAIAQAGYTIDDSDVRWFNANGESIVSGVSYIELQSGATASGYYAEIHTEGEWRQVCSETRSISQVVAYPNPVPRGEKVTLQLPGTFTGSSLNIYNITGALMKSAISLPSTVNSIDVSEYAPGIYLLQVNDKTGNRQTVKIIIE